MVKGFTQMKVVFSELDLEVNQLFILFSSMFSCHHFEKEKNNMIFVQ